MGKPTTGGVFDGPRAKASPLSRAEIDEAFPDLTPDEWEGLEEREKPEKAKAKEHDAQLRRAHEEGLREGKSAARSAKASKAAKGSVRGTLSKTAGGMRALATGEWTGVSPAGLFLGFAGWGIALSTLRYGPKGLTGWFQAKFANKPMDPTTPKRGKGKVTET